MTMLLGLRLFLLAALLATCTPAPAPEPAAQAGIGRLVETITSANRGGSSEGIPAQADQLQRLLDNDREALLLQLALYLSTQQGNEPAMGAALLIDYYSFTDDEKIAAITPHLDTDDDRWRDVLWDLLGTVDRPAGGAPDFARYVALLGKPEQPPVGLIRYMYAVSPIDALLATVDAYGNEKTEPVGTARQIESARTRPEPGDRGDLKLARQNLAALSRSDDWWVRLYAACAVRESPELALLEVAERLRVDPQELVRNALTE